MLENFETTTCGRCGGSGRYSYCSMYGSVCFGCGGTGKKYTKRGAAAVAYLKEIRAKRAEQFKVGDLLWIDAGPFNAASFVKLEKIEVDSDGLLKFHTAKLVNLGLKPDSMHRPGLTADQKAETRKRALEYQDTLTKQGKVRIRKNLFPKEVEEIL